MRYGPAQAYPPDPRVRCERERLLPRTRPRAVAAHRGRRRPARRRRRDRRHDLRRDVRPRGRAPARSTSARAFPTRTDRPRCSRPPARRSPTASTSTRPASGMPGAARGRSPSTSSGSTASTSTRHREVLVTAGATEALAATLLALVDDRRRGRRSSSRTTTRTRRSSRCAGGVHRTVPLRCARLPARPRRAARGRHRPHPDHPRELSAQPDRRRVRRTSIARARSSARRRATTRSSSPTRSTSTSSFDVPHVPIATLPGAWERTDHDLVGRQDLLDHRAGRSAGSPRPPPLVDAVLAVKQFLTYVNGAPFQPAIATGLGLPDAFFADAAAALARQARPARRRASPRPGSRCRPRRRAYFIVADAAPLGATTPPSSAANCPSAPASSASR